MNLRHAAVVLAAFAGVVACTTHEVVTMERAENLPETRDLTLGTVCKADVQCAAGLACKLALTDDTTCSSVRLCSAACSDDADCKAFDPRGTCMEGCGGEKTCMLSERQTQDLELGAVCLASSECAEGLKCLKGIGEEADCGERETCTISCTKDSDCRKLDATAKCFEGCNGKSTCMLTAQD